MHNRLSTDRRAFSFLEPLEPRLLLSAGPALVGVDPLPIVTIDALVDSQAAETTPPQPADLASTYLLLSGGVPLAESSVTIAAGQASVDVVVSPLLVYAAAQPPGTVRLTLLSDDGYGLDPLAANLTATVTVNPAPVAPAPVA